MEVSGQLHAWAAKIYLKLGMKEPVSKKWALLCYTKFVCTQSMFSNLMIDPNRREIVLSE
jgi:hypothetical protein